MRSARPQAVLAALLLLGCFGKTDEQGPTASVAAPAPAPDDMPATTDGCVDRTEYALGDSDGMNASYEFTADGLLRRYVERDRQGKELSRVERGYDVLGRRVSQTFVTSRFGSARRAMTWAWGEQGHVTATTFTDLDTQVTNRSSYQFDSQGRLERRESWQGEVLQQSTQCQYTEGEPLVVDCTSTYAGSPAVSHLHYTFALGRWLTGFSASTSGSPQGPSGADEVYTYDDLPGGRLSRRTLTSGAPPSVGTYEEQYLWDATGRVVRLETKGSGQDASSTDFTYDGAGHLVGQRWRIASSPPQEYLTEISWSGDAIEGIERRVAATGERIERWRFSRACPDAEPTVVPLAPVEGFRWQIAPIRFALELDDVLAPFPEQI